MSLHSKWPFIPFSEAVDVFDNLRKPINSKERQKRIDGKPVSELYPYYGATGQVGLIDGYLSEGEYVLLGEDGAPFLDALANKAYLINGKAWVNNHAHILRSRTNNSFLCHYLNHFNYNGFVTGTTRLKLTQADMKRIPVPVPPKKEQERIVARIEELFSQLDNGVETLQKTKQQLAVYRQAVLQQAFCPSAGWKKKTVSEIGDVNLGRQRSPKNISKQYPTKYIRAANITEQGLSLEDILDMEFTPSEREKYCLRDGDIVISEASGSASQVGKPAIWRNEIPDCCFQNTVIRHRVYTEHPEYIFWYYKYLYQSGYFSRIVGGVGINHLGAQNFANIVIKVAPYDEQMGIVEQIELKMSVCDDIEKTVGNAIQQAEAMRQSILKQAFEGHY